MEIGFLGLGIMGKAMSMNLLKHGFKVTVWNRTLSKCDELVEHGASVCETPAEVIKKCKYTIAMLSDPSAALSVVFDKDGVLEQICEGKGYIDMSTVDAETSLKINEAITGKGGRFVEGPVSGSKKPAEDGQLLVILKFCERERKREMDCLVTTLTKKEEINRIIKDTIDKVLVLRFGRSSEKDCLHLDDILEKSARDVSKFATVALVDVDSEEVQVYVKYFDITLLPSTVFFFNAHHMKLDSGTADHTKWVGKFYEKQDFIDVVEVIFRGAMKGKMIVHCPLPPERIPKYQLLYKDV